MIFLNEKIGFGYGGKRTFLPAYLPEAITKVVQNKVFTNEPESKFFVPVDYYGKKNTKVNIIFIFAQIVTKTSHRCDFTKVSQKISVHTNIA